MYQLKAGDPNIAGSYFYQIGYKMNLNSISHTFHIPVMGIGYTIDTPLKVAHYGISSVISLVDDALIEKMREFYCIKFEIPFLAITEKIHDFRAKRITAYLNLLDVLVRVKFEELLLALSKKGEELRNYIEMLPDASALRKKLSDFPSFPTTSDAINWLRGNLKIGSIDVNIMTKLDAENYNGDGKLPTEYNDAHAALRGYANSTLHSSLVLSAGMNPRLYSYLEEFEDFYPSETDLLRKKIVLKVSDYRSAFIQGKFLAKKGIWVSEYRMESGLNCGGHAFATQGHLMGPILEEFKNNRASLIEETHALYIQSLRNKNRFQPERALEVRFTAQGGVGTAEEHNFLLEYYNLDSVGWGSPFLLVPEVTNVDDHTLALLQEAKEDDLYLSNTSPLGIPFNSLKGNTKDVEKQQNIDKGRPGSACTKQYGSLNTEFTSRAICAGSRQYQHLKIQDLEARNLDPMEYDKEYRSIVEKSCICVGLGTAVLLVNDISTGSEGPGVSVCPGPNLAYFSETVSLQKMIHHIYGRINLIRRDDRPHMFINELRIYIDFLKAKLSESQPTINDKQLDYLLAFQKNIHDGIQYYKTLFAEMKLYMNDVCSGILEDLKAIEISLFDIKIQSV
jgi:hypothetical protein